jgi:hypothetical protein
MLPIIRVPEILAKGMESFRKIFCRVEGFGDRSKSRGSALHRRAMAVLNGGSSGRDDASRLKGVEPLGLVQSARGREAEERKPIAHGLTRQALMS